MKAEGNIGARARLDRGHRAGHVHGGIPGNLGELADAAKAVQLNEGNEAKQRSASSRNAR
jgi:hypothetical protein